MESQAGPLFVKTNQASELRNFQAEMTGLTALSAARCLAVPAALACGEVDGTAYLVLEWLDMSPPGPGSGARLGEGLADLHRQVGDKFGFEEDNFIGRTPQPNTPSACWIDFFRERRLGFQLNLAAQNGYASLCADGQRLLERMDFAFEDHEPVPSLVHGDLWAGNWSSLETGEPVIFDPAVYFGDRETDLAMTRLFGGFGPDFYRAYEAQWPLTRGWQLRDELYQLYHVLNHANLFGAGYARDAQSRIDRLLSRLP
jgi:protein-ribulosamine 3-kinase